jgi:hypothetical protein
MGKRIREDWFRTKALHEKLISALGHEVVINSDISKKPLEIMIKDVSPFKFRVYMFNCNNPPGGRPMNEYKIVLNTGQDPGSRSDFNASGGYMPLLIGYVKNLELFVIWDTSKHSDFAFNANCQVKSEVVYKALYETISSQNRRTKKGNEVVLVCRSNYLKEAIKKRMVILLDEMVGGK